MWPATALGADEFARRLRLGDRHPLQLVHDVLGAVAEHVWCKYSAELQVVEGYAARARWKRGCIVEKVSETWATSCAGWRCADEIVA